MKKFLVSLAGLLLMAGMSVARAQAQEAPPPPPDDQQQQAPPPEENIYDNTGAQQQPTASEVQANNTEVQQQATEQPGVARVSYVHGDVSTQRGDNGQWVAVTQNTPISNDDRVSTGDSSATELQLDYADVLRMSQHATARVANLTRSQIQVQIGQGLVSYNVLRGAEAASEIDTPNASIRPAAGDGEYRIQVNSDQNTQIIVRRGSADVSTPQGTTHVESGQMITVEGTPDTAQYRIAGTTTGTRPSPMLRVGNTPTVITPVPKISTPTATGPTFRTMARCGSPPLARIGRRIAPAVGSGNLTTAGRGFRMSRGAGRLITMAAGSPGEAIGRGGRVLS
jgi:hypothetical protein